MEADRLTRQDAKAVAKALAVAAVFWALVDFGYGWWVLGAAVLMLLLVWLAFYLERRELQRASRRWDLQSERAEANATERPQPWVWP